jgi:hypothetical protein
MEQWHKVSFSDEYSMEKGNDPCIVYVFWKPGKKEKYKVDNVIGKNKGKGILLMVWACFTGGLKGPLVTFQGINMAETYVNTLQNHLRPLYKVLTPDVKNSFIFQEDNHAYLTCM